MSAVAEDVYDARREANEAAAQRDADDAEARLAYTAARIKSQLADDESNVSLLLNYEDASERSIQAIDALRRKAAWHVYTDATIGLAFRNILADEVQRAAVASVDQDARR